MKPRQPEAMQQFIAPPEYVEKLKSASLSPKPLDLIEVRRDIASKTNTFAESMRADPHGDAQSFWAVPVPDGVRRNYGVQHAMNPGPYNIEYWQLERQAAFIADRWAESIKS